MCSPMVWPGHAQTTCDQNCDSVSIGTVETDKVQWEEPNKIYLWYYAPGMHVTIELLYTMHNIIQVVCDIYQSAKWNTHGGKEVMMST